jgi:hypothetical protein
MPKYEVKLKDIEIYVIKVRADDKDNAIDKAWEMICTEDGKSEHHYDSDGEGDATEIS